MVKVHIGFAYKAAGNYLETMESTEKAAMGIEETGNRKRPCEADILHGRPLSMGSNENMCSQGNLKRKAVTGGKRKKPLIGGFEKSKTPFLFVL